jgi:hypothetical protein
VEEKKSNGGLVCESGSETAMKRGDGAVRGREKILCLLDGGTDRHGGGDNGGRHGSE